MTFSELYERYAPDVFRFALFLCGNRSAAEDITAETFSRALLTRQTIREGTVKAYLLAIARNLYRDAVRQRERFVSIEDADSERVDSAPLPDVVTGNRLELLAALDALQQLPEHERAAVVLAVHGGMAYEEIGAALGCSVAAVKVRIHRARVKLRLMTGRKEPSP
jgi:RNA polymerase sigma-70 factor (ECF subfamily)